MKVNTIIITEKQDQVVQYLVDLGLHNNRSSLVRLAVHTIYYHETKRLAWKAPEDMPQFKHVNKSIARKLWAIPVEPVKKPGSLALNLPVIMWKWLSKKAEEHEINRSQFISERLQEFLKTELIMADEMLELSKATGMPKPTATMTVTRLDMRRMRK